MAKIKIENLPGNSLLNPEINSLNVTPQKQPKITKVTSGLVRMRDKPLVSRIFGETFRSIGGYVLWDVIIPSAKEVIMDVVTNGLELFFYGEPTSNRNLSSKLRRDKGKSYVSYSSLYDKPVRKNRFQPVRASSRHAFEDVIIESRQDAEEVLSRLIDLIDEYGTASVADFYSAVGLTVEWIDNKHGWDNLSSAEVRRIRDGYILVLPKAIPLD